MKCYHCYYRCELCDKIRQHFNEAQSKAKKPYGGFMADGSSLCWCCEHAWNQDCSWQDHKEPIPYWLARKRKLEGKITYNVEKCPQFKRRIPEWLKEQMDKS